MKLFHDNGYKVAVGGFFDSITSLFPLIAVIARPRSLLVLSSNLRSNIVTLALSRNPTVIILNGLGRLRSKKCFRVVILRLLKHRRDVRVVVQSYLDYRYLRRFLSGRSFFWIPGSGGKKKSYGESKAYVLVQRDAKITSVANDVVSFLKQAPTPASLVIVGCENERQLNGLFADVEFATTGYLDSEEIFMGGSVFIQPSGYGEGFPHTLADAIVSGMKIIISDHEFLRCGLYKLGAQRTSIAKNWSLLHYSRRVSDSVEASRIAAQTLEVCTGRRIA